MWRLAPVVVVLFLVSVPVAGAWTWPVSGPVLQGFSFDRAHPYAAGQHRGIDVGAAAAGLPVLAPTSGAVSFAGTVPSSGRSLTIDTPDGLAVTLTNLGSISVAKGDTVVEGAAVGTVGPSGTPEVAGPYLHLGIRTAGSGGLPRSARVPAGCGRAGAPAGSARPRRSARRGASGGGGCTARRRAGAGSATGARRAGAACAQPAVPERGRAAVRRGARAHRGGGCGRFAAGRRAVEPRRPGPSGRRCRRHGGRSGGAACASPRSGRPPRLRTGPAARAPGAGGGRRGAGEAAGAPDRRARDAPARASGRRASAVAPAPPCARARPGRARGGGRVRGGSYHL